MNCKNNLRIGLILIIFISGCHTNNDHMLKYPSTRKEVVIDDYFGTKIEDPYRWLENDTSAETAAWVEAQNKLTFDYLDKIPFRNAIKDRLTKIWNFPKESTPFIKSGRLYCFKNDGLQNQAVLYVKDTLSGEWRALLDPNSFSSDGTVALSDLDFSKDGKYLAYSISIGGSDWNQIKVFNLQNEKHEDDVLEYVKFSSISWQKDGIYYSRYDAPKGESKLSVENKFHKVYYHVVGTDQKDDKLVYHNSEEPLRTYSAHVTNDERYLVLSENGASNGIAVHVMDLSKANSEFVQIAEGFDYEYDLVEVVGNDLLFRTNRDAQLYKLVKVNLDNLSSTIWADVIPEKKNVLESCKLAGGKLICVYMKDAHNVMEIFSLDGAYEKSIDLPALGSVSGFSGSKDEAIGYYGFSSFVFPSTVYEYDINAGTSTIYFESDVDFKSGEYMTEQVFYPSKDGTKIPMFIVHKKNIGMNGDNPTLLYGYGGFNISLTPSFSVRNLVWLENGGVYAVANLRGGGEYGEEWHQAGTKLKKQNVFDDFIAAAEFLIKEKYTSPQKLAIMGGSNGGLLIGACINQRPELFKAAIPAVGVMDMLRFHKFTIGWHWTGDYGSSDDETQFKNLIQFSPIHNISENLDYPAVMVTTADHDDRVVPAHSFKYIATLQDKYKGSNPVLVRIGVMAGHGAGKPVSKEIDEYSDIWSFIFYNMNLTPYNN